MKVAMLVLNDMRSDGRVEREASALTEAGHAVTVFALRASDLPENETREPGYAIRRVAEHTSAGWSRPWAKAAQLRARSLALTRAAVAFGPAVVHSHDADTFRAGGAVAAKTSAAFVADAGELYSEMLLSNRPDVPKMVLGYWDRVEATGIRAASASITVGEGIAGEMESRYGVRPMVLLNVPELEVRPDASPLRGRIGVSEDTPVVIYQGLLNMGRGLDATVEAFRDLPGVHLVLQGDGPTRQHLLELIQLAGLSDRVHYIGCMKPHDLNRWASGADLGLLVLEDTSLNNRFATPNKLFQYMMAGIPTLATDLPGITAVADDSVTHLIPEPTPSEIARGLREAFADRARLRAMGERARLFADTRYNWGIEQRKLVNLYERLVS